MLVLLLATGHELRDQQHKQLLKTSVLRPKVKQLVADLALHEDPWHAIKQSKKQLARLFCFIALLIASLLLTEGIATRELCKLRLEGRKKYVVAQALSNWFW